ncbi:unnamed protein product [Thelazia callipaeda]|uniref:Aldehyde dehydrogenase n=1 Tax=Thelazia callipaeda TaxID=103827 RepID=A0A0N5D3M4_THECL|nr:unnamed protein product [Thelazia callipaeda]
MSRTSQPTTYHELVEEQRAYYASGITATLEHRMQQLSTLKKLLLDKSDILTDAVYKDLKRLPKMTFLMELSTAIMEINYMTENLKKWSSVEYVQKTLLSCFDSTCIVKEPLGVVLIIAPWNYPLCLVLLPLIAAVAAGNTVIIKPSEYAPHTAAVCQDLFSQNFDSRFLAVVNGGIPQTTELLKERFDHIFYTGGPSVAKIIMTAAAQYLTPVTLELGGKSPAIVEMDADLEISARRIAWGKWTNCGQTCIAPDYIIVKEALKPQLVNELILRLKEFYGSCVERSADYSRIINEMHFDRLSTLLERSRGQILYMAGELNRSELFFPPVIIAVSPDDVLMEYELSFFSCYSLLEIVFIFGPILPIVTISSFKESLKFICSKEKPLAAYLFTRSERKVKQLCSETSSGSVVINDVAFQFVIDTLPFGGIGQSGMGNYRGKFGFDTFTHHKALLKRGYFSEFLNIVRYPPLTEKKFKQLRVLLERRFALPNSLPHWLVNISFLFAGFIIAVLLQVCKF